MKAQISTYSYAADLNQWIPFYKIYVDLKWTGKGNLMVTHSTNPWAADKKKKYKVSHRGQIVFNKEGVCVSHPLSKKALAVGAAHRHYRLINIDTTPVKE
jgi:hypothetical protein